MTATRITQFLIGALIILAAGVAGYWAGTTVVKQSTPPTTPIQPLTITAELGTLGRSITLEGVARRLVEFEQLAEIDGTVTSKAGSQRVSDGDVILFVNLEPVTVAEGDIPGFRDLKAGDEGGDVKQLQEFLVRRGNLSSTPDGRFGTSTTRAVRDWQETVGATPTGIVRIGAIHWLPALPTHLDISALTVGDKLSRDTVLYRVLSGAPTFWLPLGTDQRNLLPQSPMLQIVFGETRKVSAILGDGMSDERGSTYELVGMDGNTLCPDPCLEVPLQATTPISVEVVVVPETTGPIVPVAAISTGPTGIHFVRSPDGSKVPVEILALDGGLALVSGVEPGDDVLLLDRSEQP